MTQERKKELEAHLHNIKIAVQDYKGTMKEHLAVQNGIKQIELELFSIEQKENEITDISTSVQ